MSENTKIQWTDATWNPIRARDKWTGQVGHYCEMVSSGCANCYSSAMQPRLFGLPKFPGKGKRKELPMVGDAVPVSEDIEVFLDEKVLRQPLKWKKPRMVFPCSMTDLFGAWVPDEWLDRVFAAMALTPQHTYQVLTKRPERMQAYLESRAKSSKFWEGAARTIGYALRFEHEGQSFGLCLFPLPNVWLGTSIENQQAADERIPILLQTPAAVRFLSVEPLLGPIDFDPNMHNLYGGIHWCIVGSESGPKRRLMERDWALSIRRQCADACTNFFMKQMEVNGRVTGDMELFPESLRVREFPR